jgi:hypothetical protein
MALLFFEILTLLVEELDILSNEVKEVPRCEESDPALLFL